ncbi:MAG: hypothetical protein PHX05_00085 [Acidobacteriota bacterium]|nr:hypothetical protein [Acidobacteriota bacterium]
MTMLPQTHYCPECTDRRIADEAERVLDQLPQRLREMTTERRRLRELSERMGFVRAENGCPQVDRVDDGTETQTERGAT